MTIAAKASIEPAAVRNHAGDCANNARDEAAPASSAAQMIVEAHAAANWYSSGTHKACTNQRMHRNDIRAVRRFCRPNIQQANVVNGANSFASVARE